MDAQGYLVKASESPAWTYLVLLASALFAIKVVGIVLTVLGGVYAHFLRKGKKLRRYGDWAVVTGATDGIGKAYAEALAKQKLRLVLISRTESRLEEEARLLQDKFGVEVKIIPADLSSSDEAVFARIGKGLEGLDIGILVNNAGMSYPHPEYLHLVDDETLANLINLNVATLTKARDAWWLELCKMVLGGMKERGRGLVVNVGSGVASAIPSGPLLSAYTASKAYVDQLSESLNDEYKEFGVQVQNQAPLFVATKMSKIRRPRIDAPTPGTWAAAAVRAMGFETLSFPYWFHALQAAVVERLPEAMIRYQVMQIHRSLRRAAYKKKARASAAALADEGASAEPKKDQ